MKKIMVVLSIVLGLAVMIAALPAVSNAAVSVEAAAISTGVEDYVPTGVGESFPYDTEKLYCYSKIIGGEAGDYVEHRWYFKDTLMATVPLTLGGPRWRTFSSKRIIRTWEGEWRVEIVHAGEAIKTLKFTITAPEEPYSEAPAKEAPSSEE